MIICGDRPDMGKKAQPWRRDLPESDAQFSPARRRLGHLFDLDERQLIDLAIACEHVECARSFSNLIC
jgi:hypothetical protein